MMKIEQTSLFKRQVKLLKKQGLDMKLLHQTVTAIVVKDKQTLKQLSDHPLKGKYRKQRELYLSNNWLLRYQVAHDHLELLLLATGNHHFVLGI